MDNIFAMAVPVLPGKTEQWKQFVSELNSRWKEDFRQSRQQAGVRERVFLQHLPQGDIVVVTFTGDNPREAIVQLGAADTEFTRWFIQKVQEIHGLDLKNAASIDLPELVADSAGNQQ